MEGSDSFNKPHLPVPELNSPILQNSCKSYTHFLYKSLIIVLVLVFIPLFPSQAPEFINQGILTKFWELLHLLFIGIAVCYGLFSRRSTKIDIETHSRIDIPQTYFSGILHVSSIFENGFENSCGYDEKIPIQTSNSNYLQSESMDLSANESSIFDQNSRSSISNNSLENPYRCDDKKLTQTWNSQYFQGESMVVVANGNYVLDQWGKPELGIDYKPLGLPIRSLRSRNVDNDSCESVNRSVSSSSLNGSSMSEDKTKNGEISAVPINLEKKLKETVVPSPIPWGSRSGRMEMREEMGTVKPPSHCRPHSVGEFEFESLKSWSFQHPKSPQESYVLKKPSCLSSDPPEMPQERYPSKKPSRLSSDPQEMLQEIYVSKKPSCLSSDHPEMPQERYALKKPSRLSSDPPEMPQERYASKKPSRLSTDPPEMVQESYVSIKPSRLFSDPPEMPQESYVSKKPSRLSFDPPEMPQESYVSKKPSRLSFDPPEMPQASYVSRVEDLERKKGPLGSSSITTSQSPLAPTNGEASFITLKTRRFSIASTSDINVQGISKDNFQDLLGGEKWGLDSLNSDLKPTTIAKGLSRGKSVRTIRSSEYVADEKKTGENHKNHINDKVGMTHDEFEAPSTENTGREEGPKPENQPSNARKNSVDDAYGWPNSTFFKYEKDEKQDFADSSVLIESEEDSERELDTFRVSSDDEEAVSDIADDAEAETDEVDRKADEFIAKFREQIRLQKTASVKGHSGW